MSKESEEPYHVSALRVLRDNYSTAEFREVIKECREVLAQTLAEDNRSSQQIARVHILKYLDRQLARASKSIDVDEDADLMALVLRNLTELRFWANYVSESEENAAQFINEATIDSREIHEKLKAVAPDEIPDLPEDIPGKRITVKRKGEREEFDFKLCSKLIHPSSLTLTHPELVLQEEQYRKYIAIHVATYGWGILNMFHNIQWRE